MLDLLFGIGHLFILLYLLIRRPTTGVFTLLILSTTTGFFSRLALYLSKGWAPFDFIRFSIEIGIIFYTAALVLRQIKHREASNHSIDFLAWTNFIFCTICVFNFSLAGPQVTLWGWRWTCLPMLLYFLGRNIPYSETYAKRVNQMFVVLLLLQSIYAIIQSTIGLPPPDQYWLNLYVQQGAQSRSMIEDGIYIAGRVRYPSLAVGHTYFSYILAASFIWVLLTPAKTFRYPHLKPIVLSMGIICILVTAERVAIGMIAIGVGVAIAMQMRRQLGRWLFLFSSIIIIFGLSLLSTIDTQSIPKTENSVVIVRILELVNPLKAETVRWRLGTIWPKALTRIIENPLGYGLGTYETIRFNQEQFDAGIGYYFPPHNAYLQRALETGVIGLLLYLWLIIAYCRILIKVYIKYRYKFVVNALALTVAVLLLGLFDPVQPPLTFFFWFTMGYTIKRIVVTRSAERVLQPTLVLAEAPA